MRTKLIIIAWIAIISGGCATPKFLPSSNKIDVNQYGSYIKLIPKKGRKVEGELIAIDSNKIIVITISGKLVSTPINQLKRFYLTYAKPKHYGWTIPVYSLATISHGFVAIISLPINLIVTISVTVSGEQAFTYNKKKLTYDQLKMFARFPQGIPDNIDTAKIKYPY